MRPSEDAGARETRPLRPPSPEPPSSRPGRTDPPGPNVGAPEPGGKAAPGPDGPPPAPFSPKPWPRPIWPARPVGSGGRAVLIHHPDLIRYRFHDEHPFDQRRLLLVLDLLEALGLVAPEERLAPDPSAWDEEPLLRVHGARYVEAVKAAGRGGRAGTPPLIPGTAGEGTEMAGAGDAAVDEVEAEPHTAPAPFSADALLDYGLGTEDVPIFPGMHEVAFLTVVGALTGARYIMDHPGHHAVFLGGGLHHAFPHKASGFCIYNDAAVAIRYLLDRYDVRVLYIDTDAHHGDGVQAIFYREPRVMTVSIHETGRYLFPGTGHVTERGEGPAFGTKVNVPLEPFTEDDDYLAILERVLVAAFERFRPDVVVSQHGVDAHRYDPLTHLALSTRAYRAIPRLIHTLADTYAGGRWLALGGGGYDLFRVVPRAWTFLWAEAAHRPLVDAEVPAVFLDRWQKKAPVPLPRRLLDPPFPPIPRRKAIREKNAVVLKRVLEFLR
ncbi:MAG: NAD-independent protein deacetylase AcuC [Hydrogenibacillus schlegelii]|uniref:Acetoin utilization protein AcuC n=1 Tax=Hydrogenibacillus schlegelii TaxID=1484 RepID=A0A2T5GBL3_HYDSH|nr:acetoin utilization protein AcuC [Hydrogenibacillus schlegelii]PTQ53584.1 MAG: NAD-independent protein deacetylase AcuC [Hydrogenibacillus schlegelii]